MRTPLSSRVADLRRIIGALGSAGVAYSGGVDSTLLLALCREMLGSERVLALTAHLDLTPAAELEQAVQMAAHLEVALRIVRFDVLSDPEIAANNPDRCYHCKRALFIRLQEIVRAEGLAALVHGANADDSSDFRPGLRAAEELGVRAPLLEAGLTKADVRALSRRMELPTWDMPAMACLASRIPYGTPLTGEALSRVEAAESALRTRFSLRQLRVRDHFPVARIEVDEPEMGRLVQAGAREEIVSRLRGLGYHYVTLDLQGFRSGSLNETLVRERYVMTDPTDRSTQQPDHHFQFATPDFERAHRKGVPEVILANRKSVEQALEITRAFLERTGRAILSRVGPELEARLRVEFAGEAELEWVASARAAILRRPDFERPAAGGRVGVITAGTSDIPIAEEAALLCREMGCIVQEVHDVGVAGLHRLFEPLRAMLEARVDALIVAAGMDGALPSVVAGLVDVPVIGLPTSVGYGVGGDGLAALYAMLQTCAPGLGVVNIDNGIGAGAVAGLIANRAAAARREWMGERE